MCVSRRSPCNAHRPSVGVYVAAPVMRDAARRNDRGDFMDRVRDSGLRPRLVGGTGTVPGCVAGDGGEGAGVVHSAGHRDGDQGEKHEAQHAPVSLCSNCISVRRVCHPRSLPANEACRSLRSCLRHHAKKENGRFVKNNSSTLIQYALRKVNSCPSSPVHHLLFLSKSHRVCRPNARHCQRMQEHKKRPGRHKAPPLPSLAL